MLLINLILVVLGSTGSARATDCGAEPQALPCVDAVTQPQRAENYWRRWHESTNTVMAGRRASPMYREPAAAMDAYWRIAAFDRERPWISEDDAAQARDVAQVGVVMGLEHMLRETFERSEALGVLYRIGSTAAGANLDIRSRHNQGPRVRYNAQAAEVRASAALLEDDSVSPRTGNIRRMRTGLALQLVDGDASEERIDPDLAMTAYADLRRVGLDAVRLQASERVPEARKSKADVPPVTGQWDASLREGLAPSVDAFFAIRGEEERGWLPTRSSGGLAVRLPTKHSWTLRTELSRRMPWEDSAGEWRAMVKLRANLRWSLPQSADGWPLGREPGSTGRDMPEIPGTRHAY